MNRIKYSLLSLFVLLFQMQSQSVFDKDLVLKSKSLKSYVWDSKSTTLSGVTNDGFAFQTKYRMTNIENHVVFTFINSNSSISITKNSLQAVKSDFLKIFNFIGLDQSYSADLEKAIKNKKYMYDEDTDTVSIFVGDTRDIEVGVISRNIGLNIQLYILTFRLPF